MQQRVEPLAQLVEHALQILRQLARELHPPPVVRMLEHQPRGVQKRPVEMGDRAQVAGHAPVDAAVERVADDRVADRAQVNADLVRAAGVDRDAARASAPAEVLRAHDARDRFAAAPRALGRHLLPVRPGRGRSARRCGGPPCTSPQTSAMYSFSTSRSWNCRASSSCAASCLATTISPDVPRSSRWTMPGRFSPPMPLRSSTWCSSALTSVPLAWPAAGWTTIPAGLSTTMRSRSW